MTERLRKSSENFSPSKSQLDEFSIIRIRAQQASKFYNSVGLSNGDLPRDVRSREKVLWPGSPEKKRTLADKTKPLVTLSQPSTPSSVSKYGATWLEPSKPVNNSEKDVKHDDRYATLPSKFSPERTYKPVLSPVRSKSSSHEVDPISPRTFRDPAPKSDPKDVKTQESTKSERKFSYENNLTTPSDSFNSLPRNQKQDPVDGVFVKEEHNKPNGIDVEKPPRVSSHLYEKQLSKTPERKVKPKPSHSEQQQQLTPVIFGKKTTPTHRKKSDNNIKPYQQPNTYLSSGYAEVDEPFHRRRSRSDVHSKANNSNLYQSERQKSPTNRLLKANANFGSTSSLNDNKEVNDSGMSGIVDQYRKNKSCHSSPAVKLPKKNKDDASLVETDGYSSPRFLRRAKGKKSKSDVPDHRIIIDRLTALQKEKEAQDSITSSSSNRFELAARRRHPFAHYDWQSMLFSFKDTLAGMESLKQKNTLSGASKAAAIAAVSTDSLVSKGSSCGSQEDVSVDDDEGFEINKFNILVASCPYFRNEIGGENERIISISATSGLSVQVGNDHNQTITEAQNVLNNHTYLSVVESDQSECLMPPNSPPRGSVCFGIENVDNGSCYYRTYFYEKEHQNYFGIHDKYGPIVVSFRREKLDEKGIHQYRLIVRTCELRTLRGSILEDAISLQRNAPNKGYAPKEVIEYLCPELDLSCLKLGMPTAKCHEQIMKIDEQNVNTNYKVGVLYCKAGQTTEEDMYNNEHGSPAFKQFLDLLGKKIVLQGFTDFKGGLDVKTDSTGTESVFTSFNGCKIMFHVSTLLPFTPTNRQQLLRKRHIGNDIVTIVFQEPGSEPFNPRHIRSHFQHVFIVVRVHNPNTDDTCYSVGVTRSRNIPRFGPAIPPNSMFPLSPTFRDFLLTKVINGENTAHVAGKFKSLAMNTREQYLRDLALNYLAQNSVESSQRLGRFSIHAASRKIKENKEKQKSKPLPELLSHGSLTWTVYAHDYSQSQSIVCLLGISDCALLVVELETKELIFSIPCQAVLGWGAPPATHDQLMTNKRDLQIYYGRGEKISFEMDNQESRDEILLRLARFTKGSNTIYRHLRRNKLGELGFRVNYEGIIVQLKPDGYAAQDGLKQSSRLVEICKIAVTTLTHDEINDLLKTSAVVTVVIIPPNEDGTPKKCSMDLYHLYPVLQVRNVDLRAPSCDMSHERSHSEPVTGVPASNQIDAARRASGDTNYNMTVEDGYQFNSFNSRDHSNANHVKLKTSKPILTKTESGNNTKTTLATSASRHALVGDTAGYPFNKENGGGLTDDAHSYNHCKPIQSFLSHHVNADWTENPVHTHTRSNNSLSSDSGLNTNNNSSYSSTLSRCSNNHTSVNNIPSSFNGILESKFMQQNNNNNNNSRPSPVETHSTLPRSNPPIRAVVWNSNKTLPIPQSSSKPKHKKDSSLSANESSESEKSIKPAARNNLLTSNGKKPVPIPRSNKKIPVPSPRSSSSRSSKHKRVVTDVPPSPSITENLKVSSSSNLSSSWTPSDVHSSLLRMIASDKKKTPSSLVRRTPSRVSSKKVSPSRKNLFTNTLSPPLLRTVSDESLCGARTDEVNTARNENSSSHQNNDEQARLLSASVDSLTPSFRRSTSKSPGNSPIRKLTSFPLPAENEWEEILDAARAAESFDAHSLKSASIGTLHELHMPPKPRYKRTASMEHVCDRPSNTSFDDLPRDMDDDVVSRSMMNNRSEAEERLERIEKKLLLLQNQLKKEQDSKKILEKEVTSLRRDNTFLLHHVGVSEPNLYIASYKKK